MPRGKGNFTLMYNCQVEGTGVDAEDDVSFFVTSKSLPVMTSLQFPVKPATVTSSQCREAVASRVNEKKSRCLP